MLAVVAACLLVTACKDFPHDGTRGLFVTVDQSACVDVPIDSIMICIYSEDGRLVAERRFAGGDRYSPVLYVVDGGCYTVVAVANWTDGDPPRPGMSHQAVMHWLTRAGGGDSPVMLSGNVKACVTDGNVTEVTVPLGSDVADIPVVRVTATLPAACMPSYDASTRSPGQSVARRFALEAVVTGTGEKIARTDTVAAVAPGGSIILNLPLGEGTYDIRLWSDAAADSDGSRPRYDTSDLRHVTVSTDAYAPSGVDGDAACGVARAVSVTAGGTDVAVILDRPLARYRLVASDVEAYGRMDGVPPLDELTVAVACEGFFPMSFNVDTDKPNDAVEGLSYTCKPCMADTSDGTLPIAADWIMANGSDKSIVLTVSILDGDGRTVSVTHHVDVPYRRGHLTTVTGNFLTSGRGTGGVGLDTDWSDDTFVIEF